MVQGNSLGLPQIEAPVATNSCGTFLPFRYLWMAVLEGVPSVWKTNSTLSSSTSLRTISTVFGGA